MKIDKIRYIAKNEKMAVIQADLISKGNLGVYVGKLKNCFVVFKECDIWQDGKMNVEIIY